MNAREFNFDGLVGPTHNYGGLSVGNEASISNVHDVSNPKQAALQGLEKMKRLHELGLGQAVLPPQERPAVDTLRRLGFSGNDHQVIEKAAKLAPDILAACCSASSMWTANAATVSPSADSADGKVHFTPANLVNKFHRSFESHTTAVVLQSIFSDENHFVHHAPLPATDAFGDEGAANHTRLCINFGNPGFQLFAYGKSAFNSAIATPARYPARQTCEASQAIARLHQLDPSKTLFAQQNPAAIDAGVFHNDVIAVGNQNTLLFHEDAFVDTAELRGKFVAAFGKEPIYFIEVKSSQVSVDEAVKSYLFNSQLLTLPDSSMMLLLPIECQETPSVRNYLQELESQDTPISTIEFIDLRQSMKNGGGPACLRLRVVLTEEQTQATNPVVFFDTDLYGILTQWIEKHYRDRLSTGDLADPTLLDESHRALDELAQILNLGSVYPFQQIWTG